MHYFRNNGDGTFTDATATAGVSDLLFSASAAFADADNDGDLDVFLGGLDGNTIFLTNAGTPTGALFVAPVTNPFGLADVGSLSRPALGDVDGDGDLDALIGAIGSTTFFLNLAPLCPAAPDPGCAAFAAGSLSVDERKPGREKLTARLSKGPELAQGAFGDPTGASGTTVALCLYDDAGAPVTRLVVDRGGESCGSKPCWKPVGKAPPEGKGFVYKDPSRSADGMAALKLQGGAAGRSSVALSASNKAAKGANALPTDIAAELATATEVTLQVHTSDARCFGATLSEVIQQDGERFKAK
jgi:hypothetical protein